MGLFGTNLSLLIGPTVALPAPTTLMESLVQVEVSTSDEQRSGFQLTFNVGRSGPADLVDYGLLNNPLLKPGNRVILTVLFNLIPKVLLDGIITNQQLQPSPQPGSSKLTITGEDVSVKMDLEEKCVEHPAQNEAIIALKIIASYAQFGLIPIVIPPPSLDFPNPFDRIPVQEATDLQYLTQMARRFDYVFFITPGLVPFTNIAYWGPLPRLDFPQSALAMNMGPQTNVTSLSFQNEATKPTVFEGSIQDREKNRNIPVRTSFSRRPPLATQPAIANRALLRKRIFRAESGQNAMQAFARAQADTDNSTDAVTAQGELDALRYNDVLRARGIVGVRGVGFNYGGNYYVKSVNHSIKKGEYKQRFTLTRAGVGSLTPVVRP